ncbi:MAG: hypothetical protein A3D44_02865 [Candidatus Staskawiczbacteria bacterium RIFCSPHIGHO2_02_FULL_42_22]|uniref:Uncharacterized protein n=1 Tax=Candidatus Staskawiczbacteria bacterium RIFCSPHIGHO2_02_FULL_42_22 TaxID=1802207 RepID=A0A1G2I4F8_9BACT|nr:MAG: hypothetical protein A3D44_02865 [Candidatus Staskawiczbacteria bacterium RIFCSPHIGHO2_02_FULL_42_22]
MSDWGPAVGLVTQKHKNGVLNVTTIFPENDGKGGTYNLTGWEVIHLPEATAEDFHSALVEMIFDQSERIKSIESTLKEIRASVFDAIGSAKK